MNITDFFPNHLKNRGLSYNHAHS